MSFLEHPANSVPLRATCQAATLSPSQHPIYPECNSSDCILTTSRRPYNPVPSHVRMPPCWDAL